MLTAAQKKQIIQLKKYGLLARPSKKESDRAKSKIEKAEIKIKAKFPEVLREVLIQYGGLTFFDSNTYGSTDIDLDEILEMIENPKRYEWIQKYIQIAREPDGSPYLIEKTEKQTIDAVVYRYGHDEGDEEPVKFAKSLLSWFQELASESDQEL